MLTSQYFFIQLSRGPDLVGWNSSLTTEVFSFTVELFVSVNSNGLSLFITLPIIQVWSSARICLLCPFFRRKTGTTNFCLFSLKGQVKTPGATGPWSFHRRDLWNISFQIVCWTFCCRENSITSKEWSANSNTVYFPCGLRVHVSKFKEVLKRNFFLKNLLQIGKNNFCEVLLPKGIRKNKFHKILLDWLPFTKINSATFRNFLIFLIEWRLKLSDRI